MSCHAMCRYDCMLLCVIGSAASGALYLLTSSAIWLGVPQILSWYGDSLFFILHVLSILFF